MFKGDGSFFYGTVSPVCALERFKVSVLFVWLGRVIPVRGGSPWAPAQRLSCVCVCGYRAQRFVLWPKALLCILLYIFNRFFGVVAFQGLFLWCLLVSVMDMTTIMSRLELLNYCIVIK